MSYCSTHENRHYGANFTSIGGVEDINVPEVDFFRFFWCSRTLISWLLHPLRTWNLYQSVYFQKCYDNYDIEFYLRVVQKKNENQNPLPPCFEKMFFRKISLRGLQWCIFSLVYRHGVGEINVWNMFGRDPPLMCSCKTHSMVITCTMQWHSDC